MVYSLYPYEHSSQLPVFVIYVEKIYSKIEVGQSHYSAGKGRGEGGDRDWGEEEATSYY